jgi:hypothetical protein
MIDPVTAAVLRVKMRAEFENWRKQRDLVIIANTEKLINVDPADAVKVKFYQTIIADKREEVARAEYWVERMMRVVDSTIDETTGIPKEGDN